MGGKITVYLPHVEETADARSPAPRLNSLEGKRVGLLSNGWRSLGITYKEFSRLLVDRYGVKTVFEKRKPYASIPLAEDDFQALVRDADCVINGLGH